MVIFCLLISALPTAEARRPERREGRRGLDWAREHDTVGLSVVGSGRARFRIIVFFYTFIIIFI